MPEEGAAKCFAYVQTYDTKPKRRLFELMKSRRFWKRSQPRISNWSVIQLKAPTPIGSLNSDHLLKRSADLALFGINR
jgi:hypothetical protein